jgi:hypothetical protein
LIGIGTDSDLLSLVAASRQGDEESACELRALFVVVLVKIVSFGFGVSERRFPWIPDQQDCRGIGCVVMTRAASPEGQHDRWLAADGENIIRRARS